MSEGRLPQLLENNDTNLAFYYLYGRLEGLSRMDNSPQARRMMHVVIRNLVDEMRPIINERLE